MQTNRKGCLFDFFGVMTVIGAASVHMFVGSMHVWGNAKGYVGSYFHQYNKGITVSSAYVVIPALVTTNTIMMLLGGYFRTDLNPKI